MSLAPRNQYFTPGRKRPSLDFTGSVRKRRSLRLQQSMSLNVPLNIDNSDNILNCYVDLPKQIFSLTYLEDNQTQNPDSLGPLNVFRKKNWRVYEVGYLFNFTYKSSQINSLINKMNKALDLAVSISNPEVKYVTEVDASEDLTVTEYDSDSLTIRVMEVKEELGCSKTLFLGYLLSWCNEVKTSSTTMLPLMLCCGQQNIRTVVLDTLSKQFKVDPKPLPLLQDDIINLFTYCLVMLGEHDTANARLSYKIPPGKINLVVPVKDLLKLWSHIHTGNTTDVDLEEVLHFYEAMELFCEISFGLKLESAQFQKATVDNYFSINVNSQISCSGTKVMHVLLKYLTQLSVQHLKVKTLERFRQTSTDLRH